MNPYFRYRTSLKRFSNNNKKRNKKLNTENTEPCMWLPLKITKMKIQRAISSYSAGHLLGEWYFFFFSVFFSFALVDIFLQNLWQTDAEKLRNFYLFCTIELGNRSKVLFESAFSWKMTRLFFPYETAVSGKNFPWQWPPTTRSSFGGNKESAVGWAWKYCVEPMFFIFSSFLFFLCFVVHQKKNMRTCNKTKREDDAFLYSQSGK